MGSHTGNKPLRFADKYFFYNDEIVRVIKHRVRDGLTECYNYDQKKFLTYETGDFKRNAKKGYIAAEVAELIGRHRIVIHNNIKNGNIPAPRLVPWMKDTPRATKGIYIFSEKDIWAVWDYFANSRRGPKPTTGKYIKGQSLPGLTPRHELTAALKQGTVYYVKLADGTFVPTWKAERF